MDTLHTKYRPDTFDQVVGQDVVVKALDKIIERDGSHSFLFAGPSGCGKTTLARICAKEVGCADKDILEIDAATHTGVDAMRDVQNTLQFLPMGKSQAKAVVVDECHTLSRQAWQSLLKVTEEPPAHVYWFLCTTEPEKIPKTIKTRFTGFVLKSIKNEVIEKAIKSVCKKEKIDLSSDVQSLIISEAGGSMRQALVNLEICRDVSSKREAAELLRTALTSEPVLEFCRFVLKGGSWLKAMALLEKLEDESPEGIRIVVSNYVAAALKKSTKERDIVYMLRILDIFSQPFNSSEKLAPLLLAIGRVLYSE
jgi:DNA polymerase III gamma/tau subunit